MKMELPFQFACLFLIVCCPRPMRLAGCVWAEVRIASDVLLQGGLLRVERECGGSGCRPYPSPTVFSFVFCSTLHRSLQHVASAIAARCVRLRTAVRWSAVQVCCQACVAFFGGGLPVCSPGATCSPGADNAFRS